MTRPGVVNATVNDETAGVTAAIEIAVHPKHQSYPVRS